MSGILQANKGKIYTVGAIGAAIALATYVGYDPSAAIPGTQGVKNIEDRYSSGGGSKTHLPGSATPLGNSDNVTGNTMKQQGKGTPTFEKESKEQKPFGSGTEVSTREETFSNKR